LHDPGLGRLRFQTEVGQQDFQLRKRSLGLPFRGAHHHHVIGEPHQDPVLTRIPCPIDPVQIDVRQQRGNDPAL